MFLRKVCKIALVLFSSNCLAESSSWPSLLSSLAHLLSLLSVYRVSQERGVRKEAFEYVSWLLYCDHEMAASPAQPGNSCSCAVLRLVVTHAEHDERTGINVETVDDDDARVIPRDQSDALDLSKHKLGTGGKAPNQLHLFCCLVEFLF